MGDIEVIEGVVAMFDNRAWGVMYSDGESTSNGFVDLNKAKIANPEFCRKPQDMTYKGSHEEPQLRQARLVRVKRTITTEVIED